MRWVRKLSMGYPYSMYCVLYMCNDREQACNQRVNFDTCVLSHCRISL